MKSKILFNPILAVTIVAALTITSAHAQTYKADVPKSITTPDTVETRIGKLTFFDGLPDKETVQKVYDNLDFSRGVEAFMAGMPAAAVYAACKGMDEIGVKTNRGVGISETLLDARSLFLTPNSTTVYNFACLDLKNGPVVMETPPGILGMVDDAYFRYVADVGMVGADKGQGGKYLFVPPDYKGEIPKSGYFVTKSPTYGHLIFYRAFVQNGDIAAAVANVKAKARVYPLSEAANPRTREPACDDVCKYVGPSVQHGPLERL